MRTKALILSAMLGVAGVVSSFAQNVYSVNVVGYMTLTLSNNWSLIANQLDNGQGNLVTNMFTGLPAQTVIYKWTAGPGGGYKQLTWTGSSWTPSGNRQMNLLPGEGVFVRKPDAYAGTNATITFVGEVQQGPLSKQVLFGFNMVSGIVPQQGGLVSVHRYTPTDQDVVYKYNNGYSQKTWLQGTARWTPGTVEPVVGVGEAIWINSKLQGTNYWNREFYVE